MIQARALATINCLAGSSLRTHPLRKMEAIHYCEPDINGKVQVWADAFLEAEGEFRNGKEHGCWIWYEPTGKGKRIVVYDNGRPVLEERTDQ